MERGLKFVVQTGIQSKIVWPEVSGISGIGVKLIFEHRGNIEVPALADLVIKINTEVATKIEVI